MPLNGSLNLLTEISISLMVVFTNLSNSSSWCSSINKHFNLWHRQSGKGLLYLTELSSFNGNPLEFWGFMRSFENSIEKNTRNECERLTFLLQYCTWAAKNAIRSCVTMDPAGARISNCIQESGQRPRIHNISKFVSEKARAAKNPVFGSALNSDQDKR